jgi:hypothetical protein
MIDDEIRAGLRPAPTLTMIDDEIRAGLRPAPTPMMIDDEIRAGLRPAPTTVASLSAVVRALKSFSARRINELRGTPGAPVWQRNYYEHVIRSDADLERIREYVRTNPARWHLDRENPARVDDDEFDRWLAAHRSI